MKIAVKSSPTSVVLPEPSETPVVPLNQQRERVIEWPHTSATNIKIHYTEVYSPKRFLPHSKTTINSCKDAEIGSFLLQQFLISKR